MQEKFFDYAQVGGAVEGGVEGEDWAGTFEAVACEMEFLHCVYCPSRISLKVLQSL